MAAPLVAVKEAAKMERVEHDFAIYYEAKEKAVLAEQI